jgi:hypothetical protein
VSQNKFIAISIRLPGGKIVIYQDYDHEFDIKGFEEYAVFPFWKNTIKV